MNPRDQALALEDIRFNTLLNADLDEMIYLCQADHHFAHICHDTYFQEERLLMAGVPIRSLLITLNYDESLIPLLPQSLQTKLIEEPFYVQYPYSLRRIRIYKLYKNRYSISVRDIGDNVFNVSTGITYQEYIHFLFELYIRRQLKS